MRPLQILNNKYTAQKQKLEYQIEAEINAEYPNVERLDELFDKITRLNMKNGYLTQILIDIANARSNNDVSNEPAK